MVTWKKSFPRKDRKAIIQFVVKCGKNFNLSCIVKYLLDLINVSLELFAKYGKSLGSLVVKLALLAF